LFTRFTREVFTRSRTGGRVTFFDAKKVTKEDMPSRAYTLIFLQRVEHPRDTLSLRDHAKIGIPADFDADIAQKLGAR
jgi:hypothetical protein